MSTHDTDPQRSSAFGGSGDTTEPGPPPEATDADAHGGDAEARLAAALIADLAKASLPTDGVRETDGHSAAAVAVAAHRPPRAIESGAAEPAVLLNTTEPLPRAALVLGGAPEAGESKGPEARPSAVLYSTVPSARVHRRQTAAVVAVIAIAVVAAAAIVAFVPREAAPPAAGSGAAVASGAAGGNLAAPSANATATAPATATANANTPANANANTTATATANAPAPGAQPVVRAPAGTAAASAPRPAASVPRAPRPSSGTFEEPDRNF